MSQLGRAEQVSRYPGAAGVGPGDYYLCTVHRAENTDAPERLTGILSGLSRLNKPVVFPVHPRTRKVINASHARLKSHIQLIDPVGYLDMVILAGSARLLLTDSGGLQEEATYFRTPCLTLRPNTERPITLTVGSNRLSNIERLSSDFEDLLSGPERKGETPPLWDGHTARRTLECLLAVSGWRDLI